jgi:hypothetical protein
MLGFDHGQFKRRLLKNWREIMDKRNYPDARIPSIVLEETEEEEA